MSWQTYSAEGDAVMEKQFALLEEALRAYEIMPWGVVSMCNLLFEMCEKELPRQGYTDTEPRGELVDRVNAVLNEIGYARIEAL